MISRARLTFLTLLWTINTGRPRIDDVRYTSERQELQNTTNFQESSSENHNQENNNGDPILKAAHSDDTEQVLPSTSILNTGIPNNNTQLMTNLAITHSSSNTSQPNSNHQTVISQDTIVAQLLGNQEKILSMLSTLQVSVDHLMSDSIKKPSTQLPTTGRLCFLPLSSKNDFDQLELKLKDETFYHNVVNDMTFVCGNTGKSKGLDSCYKLIDYFFTRHIFLDCSWTGSTRDSNAEQKIPVKFYSKIRSCFSDIIRKSDPSFTETEAEKFFKVVIKNAKARMQSKVTRLSASKIRVKKPVVVTEEENENRDESSQLQWEPNEEADDAAGLNKEADNLSGEDNQI